MWPGLCWGEAAGGEGGQEAGGIQAEGDRGLDEGNDKGEQKEGQFPQWLTEKLPNHWWTDQKQGIQIFKREGLREVTQPSGRGIFKISF